MTVKAPVDPADPRTFWDKVLIGDGCWEWQRSRSPAGYGHFTRNGRQLYAHRWAFMLSRGREPVEQVLHSCDNPPCCRPDHLFEGDQSANIQDALAKNRHRHGPGAERGTHCAKGHPFDYVDKYGKQRCRRCLNEALRAWRAHQKSGPRPEEGGQR